MNKLQIVLISVATVLIIAASVIRIKRISPLSWGWYGPIQNTGSVAIYGYDPVAYFSGAALTGKPELESQFKGVTWHFASGVNKALFDKNPEKFIPQFGGHCSYASSKGFTAKCDPTVFEIKDGKLYLFNDAKMRDNWIKELPEGVIEKAHDNWKSRPQ